MPSGYQRHHIRVDQFIDLKPYKRPNRMVPGRAIERETEKHAEKLKRDIADAWADADGLISARDGDFKGDPGIYLDFETLPNQTLPDLTWTSKGIRLATADRTEEGVARGTIYVPEGQRGFVEEKLNEYESKRGKNGTPSHEARFAAIERFRAARLESLWVDSRPIPADGAAVWWEWGPMRGWSETYALMTAICVTRRVYASAGLWASGEFGMAGVPRAPDRRRLITLSSAD